MGLLVDGRYEPVEVEMLEDGHLRGEALGLYVCWEEGMLRFFDPVTESYLLATRSGPLAWRRNLAWSWRRN